MFKHSKKMSEIKEHLNRRNCVFPELTLERTMMSHILFYDEKM